MRKHYTIFLPNLYGFPITLFDYERDTQRQLKLSEAKDAVFKAVLQGHTCISESDQYGATITIVDKDEFARARAEWMKANGMKEKP